MCNFSSAAAAALDAGGWTFLILGVEELGRVLLVFCSSVPIQQRDTQGYRQEQAQCQKTADREVTATPTKPQQIPFIHDGLFCGSRNGNHFAVSAMEILAALSLLSLSLSLMALFISPGRHSHYTHRE